MVKEIICDICKSPARKGVDGESYLVCSNQKCIKHDPLWALKPDKREKIYRINLSNDKFMLIDTEEKYGVDEKK